MDRCWKVRKVLTLAFIQKGDEVLLGLKKRGFGAGLWNGFGGKVEMGESVPQAAAREVKEECGLEVCPSDLIPSGVIHFLFEGDPVILEVHIFSTSNFSGQLMESDEMKPQWWHQTNFPFAQMWPDDPIWYPFFKKGIKFNGIFLFRGETEVLGYRMEGQDLINGGGGLLVEDASDKYELPDQWSQIRQLPLSTNAQGVTQ